MLRRGGRPEPVSSAQLRMPKGGLDVRTRVTRRSEVEMAEQRRIETSEYIEQAGRAAGCFVLGWRPYQGFGVEAASALTRVTPGGLSACKSTRAGASG
jgi:hypothetical protein